jgi:hypothetical protein
MTAELSPHARTPAWRFILRGIEKPQGQRNGPALPQPDVNTLRTIRGLLLAGLAGLALLFSACGGGGGGGGTTPAQNPRPNLTSISPTAANTGEGAFTLTVNGSSFISSSVVRWNGMDRPTTFVSSVRLTAAIPASDIAADGTAQVTVFNPPPGGGTSSPATFTISAPAALAINSTLLPPSAGGKNYEFVLMAAGGIAPLSWNVSAGALPAGLMLDPATGRIAGTINDVASETDFPFTVRVTDAAFVPSEATRSLILKVFPAGSLGSNNTRAGATPISNGTIAASISPYGDEDFYSFHASAGATVTIEITARRLVPPSQLDAAIEIQDGSGARPSLCRSPGYPFGVVNGDLEEDDPTPNEFDDACVNDDLNLGVVQDSFLEFQPTLPGTYYVRVLDLRGDGRPDLKYELALSGAD